MMMLALLIARLRQYWPETVGGALVLALTLWWGYCRPTPAPLPVAAQRSLDSLTLTAPLFQAQQRELVAKETVYVARAVRAEHVATTEQHAADSLAAVGDSVAKTAPDTATPWFRVAQLRAREADSLRVAVDSLTSSNAAKDSALAAADARAVAAVSRLSASELLNQRLAKDVATAGQCHVLPFVTCPSRRVSFVVGGMLAAAAVVALRR